MKLLIKKNLNLLRIIIVGFFPLLFFYCSKENNKKTAIGNEILLSSSSPLENRFTRTVLADHLNEPLELAVTDAPYVYLIERTGAVKKYNYELKTMTFIDSLQVNAGEGNGLLGLTVDPDFNKNNFIYFFYTPKEKPVRHQVSRFKILGNHLDKNSEKVLIKIPIEYEPSYHTGGSLQFDSKGNLFISVGDNTDPSQSDGFAPIDERKGRLIFDAQRSSGNTNDLRGKILRITPLPAGTYKIPEGNLFPKDGSKGKPEIYIMGCRNPYRLSVDTENGFLYWGEVGPDSGIDSIQGPKGYDEINQARKAGYYGWPYFVADNKAFYDFDFQTKKVGKKYDSNKPINESVNNTGAKELPPAQIPLIWYPYQDSKEFPPVKNGGRSAMAGPVYHFDEKSPSKVKFPKYFDKALFFFDWMRNWLMVVKMTEDGKYKSMEQLLPSTRIDRPIDMQFAKDGSLYLIEYGENYGMNNPDASLVKITFNPDNRPPLAIISANDSVGKAPLEINLSANKSFDEDNDKLTYQWFLDEKIISENINTEITLSKNGTYNIKLSVRDIAGNVSQSTKEIKIGNAPPDITLQSTKNKSFYWGEEVFPYYITVKDEEDKGIDRNKIKVSLRYFPDKKNILQTPVGHQQIPQNIGAGLIEKSDCKSCHIFDKHAVGPSFIEISNKYKKEKPVDKLVDKVIKGGAGVWGPHAMSAHPQLKREEVGEMVKYILSLTDTKLSYENLAPTGSIVLKNQSDKKNFGTFMLTASYSDKGTKEAGSATSYLQTLIRYPQIEAEDYDEKYGMKLVPSASGIGFMMGEAINGSYLVFKEIDLKDIGSLTYQLSSSNNDGEIELHIGSPDGEIISKAPYRATGGWYNWKEVKASVKKTDGYQNLYFKFISKSKNDKSIITLDWIRFDLK